MIIGRKIKCDCGKVLEEKETKIEHIQTPALVCPSCGFTTLIKEQAKIFQRRLTEKEIEEFSIKLGKKITSRNP